MQTKTILTIIMLMITSQATFAAATAKNCKVQVVEWTSEDSTKVLESVSLENQLIPDTDIVKSKYISKAFGATIEIYQELKSDTLQVRAEYNGLKISTQSEIILKKDAQKYGKSMDLRIYCK